MRIWRLSAAILLTAALVATGVFVSGVVQASHTFSDVPTGAFYHNAVEWVFNRGITAGCAAGLYCPNDAVTRGQMAVFLQKVGQALTPQLLRAGGTGAVDPDAFTVICQTANIAVTGYPRQAFFRASVSLLAAGAMQYYVATVFSTDGGATWDDGFLLGSLLLPSLSGASSGGEWAHASHMDGPLNLAVGTTYRFGVRVGRDSGTADAANSRCLLNVEVFNRNPTTSPLAPQSQTQSGISSTRGR